MSRPPLRTLMTVVGFTLAGCVVGGTLGFIAPGFLRVVFKVDGSAPFDPREIGVGSGVILGFLSGTVVLAIGTVASALSGLSQMRLLGRRAFQPTFAGLMLAVALVAMASASLKNPTRVGAQLWFVFATLSLASASLLALSRPAEERGSATGFAVLGWSYLILSIFPESRAQLPTSDLLAALEKRVSDDWRMGVQVLSLEMGPLPARHGGAWWEPVVTFKGGIPGKLEIDDVQPEFRRIGHSLFALLLGIAGGVIGDLHLTSRRIGPRSP